MHRAQPIPTLPLFLGIALVASQTLAADFTGRVVGVSDGDTITVLHNGNGERIWLHGIDCPEKRQAFGNRAKQFTSRLTYWIAVTVNVFGLDRDGRTVGEAVRPKAYNGASLFLSNMEVLQCQNYRLLCSWGRLA